MDNLCSWDKIWSETNCDKEFRWWIERENEGIRGRKILSYLNKHLGNINGVKIIEVGAGMGVYSFILAKRGASVTLMDYSKEALSLANRYFDSFRISASFLYANAINLNSSLREKFDVAMSFGTIEHYRYPERFLMAAAHFNLVRPGGIVIISVPNRCFFPHELMKFYLQKKDKWRLGYEGAFTRRELQRLGRLIGLENIEVGGSAFITDIARYLHIFRALPKSVPSCDLGTPFDNLFGADIFLMGRRPSHRLETN